MNGEVSEGGDGRSHRLGGVAPHEGEEQLQPAHSNDALLVGFCEGRQGEGEGLNVGDIPVTLSPTCGNILDVCVHHYAYNNYCLTNC